jgi:hypothetical protein
LERLHADIVPDHALKHLVVKQGLGNTSNTSEVVIFHNAMSTVDIQSGSPVFTCNSSMIGIAYFCNYFQTKARVAFFGKGGSLCIG